MVWSGPYSYSTAPIEMVFGALKFGEINPEKKPTGKRVSDTSFITDPLVFGQSSGDGRCKAPADAHEHLHHLLAQDYPEPVQLPLLLARLSTSSRGR